MRGLIASEFVTLDGVIEGPGHDEHRAGRNAWALRATTEDQQKDQASKNSGLAAPVEGDGDAVARCDRFIASITRCSPS
jgi:hypothetical protein